MGVSIDSSDAPQFYDPAPATRGDPAFYGFNLRWLVGKALRSPPLIERKRLLESIIPAQLSVLLYAGHIERRYRVLPASMRAGLERDRGELWNDLKRSMSSRKHRRSLLLRSPRSMGIHGSRSQVESHGAERAYLSIHSLH